MIDRELFMGVKFEELVNDDWSECEEINVLDWAQYLKDRARWKVEGRFAVKTTALAALRRALQSHGVVCDFRGRALSNQ